MNRHRVFPLLALLIAGSMLLGQVGCAYLPFRRKKEDAKSLYNGRKPTAQGLVAEISSTPEPVKLGEVRQLNVKFILRNVGKKISILKFPTTQVIEILLRDPNSGQVISQWSSERAFTSDPRLVVINPGERVEYDEPITTRELKAGRAYTLEAYVVGRENELRATKAVLPQP